MFIHLDIVLIVEILNFFNLSVISMPNIEKKVENDTIYKCV